MNFPTFTVLVVEDFVADRELYRRSLDQEPSCLYELLEADSVAAGLKLCQTRSMDCFEYARINRSEDAIEPVAVAQLLADVVDEVAPPSTFTIDLPTALPTLFTKRLPLFQIFVNLVGNGIKYHHSETGVIKVSIEDRGNWYEFAIADDVPGIALQDQERMFEIFQAVNPQNRSDSTGIGLAIVKKFIKAEGGTIWLESEIGKGTTFYFTWPKRLGRLASS